MFSAFPQHEGTLTVVRSLEVKRQMDAASIEEVSALISDAWRADGARPLNDHLWLDLREGGRQGFAGVITRDHNHDHITGYCQVSRGNESWSLELVIHPHHRYDSLEIAPDLLRAALDVVASEGGGHVHWWVFEASNVHRQLAQTAGLRPGRRLMQMRRSLPLEDSFLQRIEGFSVSAFRPGIDEEAWLAVNNAAFAHHPEQGGWTREIMDSRIAEPWFDPAGFHMHWEHDVLRAFCWTKIHSDTEPNIGEIYVIAVDPSATGSGLGTKMTIAALHHLAQQNIPVAMLYVDADNAAAISVYTALGFRPHHNEHAFVGDVPARAVTT